MNRDQKPGQYYENFTTNAYQVLRKLISRINVLPGLHKKKENLKHDDFEKKEEENKLNK